MSGPTFDTLKFSETLRDAGIPETQAKAISNAVRNAYDTAELVTKTDLREAVSELRSEIQASRSETMSEIQASRSDTMSGIQALRGETRSEIQALRGEAKSEMQTLRADLRSDIQRLDARIERLELQLTVRLGGLVVVSLGAFSALSKWIA